MTQNLIDQLTREFHTAKAAANAAWRVAQTHKNEIKFAHNEADRVTKLATYREMFAIYEQAQAAADQAWQRLEAAKIEAEEAEEELCRL